MLNDLPTKTDLLGRLPFAESIARVIVTQTDPAPQVIAIDGAWGDGKTTVFGFLLEALEKQGFKVVPFNPWRCKDEDALLRAFALGLAEKLGVKILNKGEQWVEVAMDRSELVEQTAGIFGLGALGRLFHLGARGLRQSIDQLLNRVKGILNEHGKRVTVLVDDSDRLEADQLMNLLKLVKLTADFEWLTFVLAMDCSSIARTIGQKFGGDDEGRRFLEKIVQVPVRLPDVPHERMREFTLNLVQGVISDLGIDPSKSEVERFREVFDGALMPFITTPRLAKQYANIIRFTLGLLREEVNAVDVMLLEGFRLLLPDSFTMLVQRVAPATNKSLDEELVDHMRKDQKDWIEEVRNKILPKGDIAASRRSLNGLLATLFPRDFSAQQAGDGEYRQWEADKRVACEDYMWRYLNGAVPDHDVADAELNMLLIAAGEGDQTKTLELLRPMLEPRRARIGAKKLRRLQDRVSDPQRKVLAMAIAQSASMIIRHDVAFQFETPFGESAMAAAHFVRDLKPMNEREQLASQVIAKAASTLWADEFFSWLPHDRDKQDIDEKRRKLLLPRNESERIGAILAERIMTDLEGSEETPPLELLRKHSACAKFGQANRFRKWVIQRSTEAPDFVGQLTCAMMTWSYGDSGRTFAWPGDESALRSLEMCYDIDWFRHHISCEEPPQRDDWHDELTSQEALYQLVQLAKQKLSVASKPDAELSAVK